MDTPNVQIGQIRVEDRLDEAKIHEPIPLDAVRYFRNPEVENNDEQPESQSVLPFPRARKVYRSD